MIKIAINGFGRIGRTALRVWLNRPDLQAKIQIVAINTSGSMPVANWAHLLKYDTAYGPLSEPITTEETQKPDKVTDQNPLIGYILHTSHRIPVLAQRDPTKLPWGQYQPDVVIEATGVFRDLDGATKHLTAGAKKVLISAPAKGGTIGTYVLGANEYPGGQALANNASCTTNCIAPVAAILEAAFGIAKATMTTIHAYTDDQNLQDGSHKDLRRARAAAGNIIPTSTGAAIATTETIPQLKGLFDGLALRVPVTTGSISDITIVTKRKTTVDEVNQVLSDASTNPRWEGIVATTTEPLVSSDIIGRPESAIVDLSLTQVVDGDLVKVLAWYDNEWGYCNRLLEQAIEIGSK